MTTHQPSTGRARGFTLIELLTVVVIIVVLFAVLGPGLDGLLNSGRVESSVTVVSTAVSAARSYAGRDEQFLSDLQPGNSNPGDQTSDANGDGYSGAAIVFTPAGELRLVENYEHARDGNGNYLEMGENQNWSPAYRNGYREITGREPMTLPGGAAVVGIYRTSNEPKPMLLPPPFAIRFNEHGNLISGRLSGSTNSDRYVYYDGSQNNEYAVSRDRSNPYGGGNYQPEQWMPESQSYIGNYEPDDDPDSPDEHEETGRRKLPLEALTTVVGVIAYDFEAFKDAGHTLSDELDSNASAARDWILENGTPVLINRQTGTVVNKR